MAEVIAHPYIPADIDAVTWSSDCRVAVASQDIIHILVPNLQSSSDQDTLSRGKLWQEFSFKVNEFTTAEVPLGVPISYAHYSIGEELSESLSTAIRWSPPGLGQYQRSVLAVLTANHVLSLWTQPQKGLLKSTNWERVLIINHKLLSHQESSNYVENSSTNFDPIDLVKTFQRIRSFCWCPTSVTKPNTEDLTQRDSIHLLAVANDDAQIIILGVQSPYTNTSATSDSWSATIVGQFNTKYSTLDRPNHLWTFEDYMLQRPFASHVTWSPWFVSGGSSVSFIAYALPEKLCFRKIVQSDSSLNFGVEVDEFNIEIPISLGQSLRGALTFDKVIHRKSIYLLYQLNQEIVCTSISIANPSKYGTTKYKLEDWSEVAGLAISPVRSGERILHVITADCSTALQLKLPQLKPRGKGPQPWQDRVQIERDFLSTQKNLGAKTKAWYSGVECSPLGDLLLTLFHVLPTDVPMYYISSERKGFLTLIPIESYDNNAFLLPRPLEITQNSDINAEAITLSIKFRLSSLTVKSSDTVESIMHGLLSSNDIAELNQKGNPYSYDPELEPLPTTSLFNSIESIFLNKSLQLRRLIRLITILLGDYSVLDPINVPTFSHVAHLLDTVSDTFQDSTSTTVLSLYESAFNTTSNSTLKEVCEICDDDIEFTRATDAICNGGHEFLRCALTLLAIQAPGISKYCDICGKTYLDEARISSTHQAVTPDNEMTEPTEFGQHSLAEVLLTACRTCVYCGGRFVK